MRKLYRFNSRRGVTLVELSMGIAIASLLMIIVAGVQFISGRAIKDMYNKTRTRSSQTRAIDQIRYLLSEAMDVGVADFANGTTQSVDIPTDYTLGTTNVLVDDPDNPGNTISLPKTVKNQVNTAVNVTAYDTVTFRNPNLGSGVSSRLSFNSSTRQLLYDNDISSSGDARAVVTGPIDIRFVPLAFDAPGGVLTNGASRSSMVLLMVRSQAFVAYKESGVVNGVSQYSVIDQQDGLTTVYLRNTTSGADE